MSEKFPPVTSRFDPLMLALPIVVEQKCLIGAGLECREEDLVINLSLVNSYFSVNICTNNIEMLHNFYLGLL